MGHRSPGEGSSIWRDFLSSLVAGRRVAEAVLAQNQADVVQVRNDIGAAFVALGLRRRHGARFVYQRSFPYAELGRTLGSREPTVPAAKRRMQAAVVDALELHVMKRADLVLAISEAMRSDLVQRGIPPDRVISFPLGVDTRVKRCDHDGTKVRRLLELGDRTVLLYFGSLDRLRRPEFLLQVMSRVRRSVPDAMLLLVGSAVAAADLAWLRGQIEKEHLSESVRLVDAVPRSRISDYLAAADVVVSPIPPLPLYTVSSPTKTLESLGMGVPVIGNREIPDQRDVLEASRGGFAVPYEPTAFSEAIVTLVRDPDRRRAAGLSGRDWVAAHRSYDRLADIAEQQYLRLCSKG
jgi:glycosyltransferase involved in cell wall biosynthesis